MNEYYEPTSQDYCRTVILGVVYTIVVQLLNICTYRIANTFTFKIRIWHHLYWTLVTVLKYLTIVVLLYPQLDEVIVPRKYWNVTQWQILIIGSVMSITEYLINAIGKKLQKSILYNFYIRQEIKQYKLLVESNEQRLKSSISQIYQIKRNLKQQQVFQRYYASDENTLMILLLLKNPPFDIELKFQHEDQLSNKQQTLILGSDTQSRIVPTVPKELDTGRQKSRASSKRSVKTNELSPVKSADEHTIDDVLLNVNGLLNTQEYIINLEMPLDSHADLDLGSDIYEMLSHSKLLRYSIWWKLDTLIYNLFECFTISTIFLYKIPHKLGPPLLVLLIVMRCFRFEIWRYCLIVRFTLERLYHSVHSNYGSVSGTTLSYDNYCHFCLQSTWINIVVDLILLLSITLFIQI